MASSSSFHSSSSSSSSSSSPSNSQSSRTTYFGGGTGGNSNNGASGGGGGGRTFINNIFENLGNVFSPNANRSQQSQQSRQAAPPQQQGRNSSSSNTPGSSSSSSSSSTSGPSSPFRTGFFSSSTTSSSSSSSSSSGAASSSSAPRSSGYWQRHASADEPEGAAPPASASALSSLPDVKVNEEDIKDEANSTCCVCLENYELGEKATRLPCGHLLHRECVTGWLKKHCTCPVCRYELRTDNMEFERGRHVRMAEQRPRYRLAALKGKSVHELRRLASAVGVNVRGCLEKQDLVDRLVESERIYIIPEEGTPVKKSKPSSSSSSSPASNEYRVSDLEAMGVGSLRKLMLSLGGPSKGMDPKTCIEKSDMVKQIVKSGVVKILPEKSDDQAAASEPDENLDATIQLEEISLDQLNAMGISDIQQMMTRLHIDIPLNFIEKSELVQKLLNSGKVSLVFTNSSSSSSADAVSNGAAEDVNHCEHDQPSFQTEASPTTPITGSSGLLFQQDCPLCTYHNKPGARVCEMCENSLPQTVLESQSHDNSSHDPEAVPSSQPLASNESRTDSGNNMVDDEVAVDEGVAFGGSSASSPRSSLNGPISEASVESMPLPPPPPPSTLQKQDSDIMSDD